MHRMMFTLFLILCLLETGRAQDPPKLDRHGDPLPAGALVRLGTIRPRAAIHALDVSADGKWIATAEPGVVRVWDAVTRKELHAYPGHVGQVRLALTPDGKILFTADDGGTIRQFEVATGKKTRSLASAHRGPTLLAVSADGRTLVSGGQDGSVRQWLVAAGIEVRLLGEHTGPIVALNVVDKQAWSAGLDGRVRAWDLVQGGETRTQVVPPLGELGAKGRMNNLPPVAFSSDAKWLAVGKPHGFGAKNEDGVRIWDLEKERPSHGLKLPGPFFAVTTVAFALHGRTLACGDSGGHVRIFGVASGKELRDLEPLPGTFGVLTSALAFDPQGKFLVRANQELQIIEPVGGESSFLQREGHVSGLRSGIHKIGFAKDGQTLLTIGLDRTVLAWDTKAGREIGRLPVPALGSPPTAVVSPDGPSVFWIDNQGKAIMHWRFEAGKFREVRRFEGLGFFMHLALSRDGNRLAAGGAGISAPTVLIWDVATGKEQAKVSLQSVSPDALDKGMGKGKAKSAPTSGYSNLTGLAFTPNGRALVSRPGNEAIQFWDIATGQPTRSVGNKFPGTMSLAPDGRTVAFGLRLVEVATGGDRLLLPSKGVINTLTFSPDGTLLASGDSTGFITLVDVVKGTELTGFKGHNTMITDLAFSPKGDLLASAGSDATVLVWSEALWKDRPGPEKVDLQPDEIALVWNTLRELDAARAYRVIGSLAATGDATTGFLKDKLQPLEVGAPKMIAQWIADLDSKSFADRQKAQRELERANDLAESALLQALQKPLPLEVQRRIEQILTKLKVSAGDKIQAQRGVEILERIGTPQARAILQNLSKGTPGLWLTQDAADALERLKLRQ